MSARRTSPPSMGLLSSTIAADGSTPLSSARPTTPQHSLGASGASILHASTPTIAPFAPGHLLQQMFTPGSMGEAHLHQTKLVTPKPAVRATGGQGNATATAGWPPPKHNDCRKQLHTAESRRRIVCRACSSQKGTGLTLRVTALGRAGTARREHWSGGEQWKVSGVVGAQQGGVGQRT